MAQDLISSWFVRLDQRVHGPLSVEELEQLQRDNALTAVDEISADGTHWVPAATRWATMSETTSLVSQVPATTLSPPWLLALVAGGILCFLFLFVTLAICAGVLSTPNTPSPANPATTAPSEQAAAATWVYWHAVATELAHMKAEFRQVPDPMGRISQAADHIEGLTVVNVHPDAVVVAKDTASMLKHYLEFARSQNDPHFWLDAMVRGTPVDHSGLTQEHRQKYESINQYSEAIRQQVATIQTSLTQRYGFEFSPLGF